MISFTTQYDIKTGKFIAGIVLTPTGAIRSINYAEHLKRAEETFEKYCGDKKDVK